MGAERLDGWIDGASLGGSRGDGSWIEGGARARPAKVLARAPRFAEALALSARRIVEMPLPPSLGLHVPGVPGVVRVELDRAEAEAARREGELVLDRDEWCALVLGAEADRLWPSDLAALCRRKVSEPSFRIDAESALAGAQPDRRESWSVARVLSRVGADLLSIDVERRSRL